MTRLIDNLTDSLTNEKREGRSWWTASRGVSGPLQTFSAKARSYGVGAVILTIAAAIRLYRLGDVDPWIDEGFCLRMTEFSYFDIWDKTAQDTHPPLYFWLLKLWQSIFGESIESARLMSVVLGTLTVLFSWLFARELTATEEARRDSNAWLAATIIALSPMHIHWASQVRMYVLLTTLSAAAAWLLVRVLKQSECCYGIWLLFAFLASSLVYTHVYGIFTVAALYGYTAGFLIVHRLARNHLWPCIVSMFAVYQVCSPWLLVLLEQQSRVRESFWIQPLTWESLGKAVFDQFYPTSSVSDAFPAAFKVAESALIGQCLLQLIVILLLGLCLSRRRFDGLLICLISIPMAISVGLSIAMRNIILGRYLIAVGLFVLVSIALVIARIPNRHFRTATGVFFVAVTVLLSSAHIYARKAAADSPALSVAVREYEKLRNKDEPIVVADPVLFLSVRPLANRPDSLRAFGSLGQHPFYLGTAVMSDLDFIDSSGVDALPRDWVWTLASIKGGRRRHVQLSSNWQLQAEKTFTKPNEKLILRLFRRRNGT